MQFDLKQAATYFFQDKDLFKKLSWLYAVILLFFIPIILCSINNSFAQIIGAMGFIFLYLVWIVFAVYFCGYFALTVNRRIIKAESTLPEINDWKNCFKAGGKFFLGSMAWSFILQMLLIAVILIVAIVMLAILFSVVAMQSAAVLMFKSFSLLLFGVIFVATALMYLAVLLAVFSSFYTDLRIESFFDIEKIKHIICNNYKPLIKLIGWSLILGLLLGLSILILAITLVGIIAIPLAYAFYFLMFCDIKAQFIRYVFKINQNEAING